MFRKLQVYDEEKAVNDKVDRKARATSQRTLYAMLRSWGFIQNATGNHRRSLCRGGAWSYFAFERSLSTLWRTERRGAEPEAETPIGRWLYEVRWNMTGAWNEAVAAGMELRGPAQVQREGLPRTGAGRGPHLSMEGKGSWTLQKCDFRNSYLILCYCQITWKHNTLYNDHQDDLPRSWILGDSLSFLVCRK